MYISLYIYTYIFGDLTQMPTAMHIQVGVGSIRKRIDRYPWQNLGLTSAREIAQQDTRVAKGFPWQQTVNRVYLCKLSLLLGSHSLSDPHVRSAAAFPEVCAFCGGSRPGWVFLADSAGERCHGLGNPFCGILFALHTHVRSRSLLLFFFPNSKTLLWGL